MLNKLMRHGGYSVSYLNDAARGNRNAVGFYVRGEMSKRAGYSVQAKHHLYLGLSRIREVFGFENLVGIYIDVDKLENLARPAYLKMKEDLHKGLFRRVFVVSAEELVGDAASLKDVELLHREVSGFELVSMNSNWQKESGASLRLQEKSLRMEGIVSCPML